MHNELRFIGIDPGLAHTGWGVIGVSHGKARCIAYGCVETPSTKSDAERLATIYDELDSAIKRYGPSELAVESVYFGVNAKSAFGTGQARGAALIAAAHNGLSTAEYSPPKIKLAVVGTGTAEKEQVQYMVRMILNLDHIPNPDHAADALAVAITHNNLRRSLAL